MSGKNGRAGQAGDRLRLAELRVDLLAADDGDGHDRRAGPQRHLDEAAAAEALQPVAVREVLARPLDALGEDGDELVLLEQADRVVGRGRHAADLADRWPTRRAARTPSSARGSAGSAAAGARAASRRPSSSRPRAGSRRGSRRAARGRGAGTLRTPSASTRHQRSYEELEEREDRLGELLVEAPLVLAVVARRAAARRRRCRRGCRAAARRPRRPARSGGDEPASIPARRSRRKASAGPSGTGPVAAARPRRGACRGGSSRGASPRPVPGIEPAEPRSAVRGGRSDALIAAPPPGASSARAGGPAGWRRSRRSPPPS